MKKLFTTLMLLTLISSTLMAVPAKRTPRTFTQPDGTTVTIVLQGDEHFHYYATTDGVMVKKDTDGYMKYAITNSDGNIIPGEYKAKNLTQRNELEKTYIAKNKKTISEKAQTTWRKSSMRKGKSAKIGNNNFPNKGQIRGLIIMAEFKDEAFSPNGTRDEFTKMMNETDYKANGATGSSRDYFLAQSHNEFQPTFDVVGPVTLTQNMAYYGGNDAEDNDKNPGQMVVDACNLAKTKFNTDFSNYDLDNDGSVDLVYIVYAGYGEAQGGAANTIWPHAWDLTSARKSLTLDGKKINNYACSSELYGNKEAVLDGIGTFCHEFSHCLGLPDMYDIDYGGNFGLGEWDIMDGGSYNNDGKTPPSYSALERSKVGWMELEELTTPQDGLMLEALNTSNKAYVIKSTVNSEEYFILENRQLTGWDAALPNHGLLITHVDFLQSAWEDNSFNDVTNHQRAIIVPADNELFEYDGDYDTYWEHLKGDVYPGTSGNTSFSDTSKPAATLYKGGTLSKPITNIKEENGIITFNFMEGIIVSPVLKEVSDISATGFTANWEAVEGVDSYSLTIKEASNDPDENLVLKEDFTGFTSSSDGAADISASLDTYMNNKGWKGSKIYNSSKRCKMGSGKGAGVLTSPALDLSTGEGAITVYLKASEYGTTENKLTVKLLNPSGSVLEEKAITLPTSIITFTQGNTNCKISFTASNRAYISHIGIYTGDYEESDLSETKAMPKATTYNQTIDAITDTRYAITGLNPNTTYSYKVSAKKGDNSSEFSSSAKVTTLDPTGIDCNPTELYNSISTNGNYLYVSTEEGNNIKIYSIDGILKQSVMAQEGENQIELPNGIYIARVGNASAKVIISAK